MQIVVIEDDAELQEFLSAFLKTEGFDVLAAYTGMVGLQLIHKHNPDLVIVDIQLPRMLHLDIVRASHAHARIVEIDTSEAVGRPGVVGVTQSNSNTV